MILIFSCNFICTRRNQNHFQHGYLLKKTLCLTPAAFLIMLNSLHHTLLKLNFKNLVQKKVSHKYC